MEFLILFLKEREMLIELELIIKSAVNAKDKHIIIRYALSFYLHVYTENNASGIKIISTI